VLTITSRAESSLSPERVLELARDFSPQREKVWTNGKTRYLEVHESGEQFADVTEGGVVTGLFWERSSYDWSQPGMVRATVTASNVFAPGSTWEVRAARRDGGSSVEMILHRGFQRGLKGRIGALLNHTAGKWFAWDQYLRRALATGEKQAT
jgi:hypothetical protein